jgi:hypothetical protein
MRSGRTRPWTYVLPCPVIEKPIVDRASRPLFPIAINAAAAPFAGWSYHLSGRIGTGCQLRPPSVVLKTWFS